MEEKEYLLISGTKYEFQKELDTRIKDNWLVSGELQATTIEVYDTYKRQEIRFSILLVKIK